MAGTGVWRVDGCKGVSGNRGGLFDALNEEENVEEVVEMEKEMMESILGKLEKITEMVER